MKESTEIPEEVYNAIKKELKVKRIVNFEDLTLGKIKGILKDLYLQSYYEHAVQIKSRLSNLPPPSISRDTEDFLRQRFRDIQIPFQKHCPTDRVNFLSYSYVLHKFFQLMGLDDLLKYFPLLKSMDKLRQQDKIWKKICDELMWEFIPSI